MTHKAWKMVEEKLEAVFIAVISFSVGKNRFSYIAVNNVNINFQQQAVTL